MPQYDNVMAETAQPSDPLPPRRMALALLAAVAVVALGIAAAWWWRVPLAQMIAPSPAPASHEAAPPAAPASAPIPATPKGTVANETAPDAAAARGTAPGETTPTAGNEAQPRFDIVRVTREGTAVIAGRAAPGAEVTILEDGNAIGRATADAAGEFVFTPDAALAPGPHAIALAAKSAAGAMARSESDVLVVVPGREGGESAATGAVAALAPNGPASADMPKLLQAPAPDAAANGDKEATPAPIPRIDVLDYDQAGHLRLSGHAAPGDKLRLAIDGRAAGEAAADQGGEWSMAPSRAVAPGKHRLELVARDGENHVTGRLALPFLREALERGSLKPGMVVVQPGQNLWRIARDVYGSGIRYTIIYAANREHIRKPGIIYPGQTLFVPPAPGMAAPREAEPETAPGRGRSPASSSTSR